MSHSINAFETSVFRVKDVEAFKAALAPLSSTFRVKYSDLPSGRFCLAIASECESWPSCNESAYMGGKMPEGMDPYDSFDFTAFLQPHLCPDSACVVKYVSIKMRQAFVTDIFISLDVITPDGSHYFYPDSVFRTIPGADRFCVEWR